MSPEMVESRAKGWGVCATRRPTVQPDESRPNMGKGSSERTCSIENCGRRHAARGWCTRHYEAWRVHGNPLVKLRTWPAAEVRFWAKVEKTAGCWLWMGSISRNTLLYGSFSVEGKPVLAHRYSYELNVGPIPEGLVIDHLCREPRCVNPEHLEPVTMAENSRRARGEKFADTCGRGHSMIGSEHNVARNNKGQRYCRTCFLDAQKARRARYRATREAEVWLDQNPESPAAQVLTNLLANMPKVRTGKSVAHRELRGRDTNQTASDFKNQELGLNYA